MPELFLLQKVGREPVRLRKMDVAADRQVSERLEGGVSIVYGHLTENGVQTRDAGGKASLVPFGIPVTFDGPPERRGWQCWFTDVAKARLAADFYNAGFTAGSQAKPSNFDCSSAGFM